MSSSAGRRVGAIEKQLQSFQKTDGNITMASLEVILAEAVKAQKVPQVVVYATNKDGRHPNTIDFTIEIAS